MRIRLTTYIFVTRWLSTRLLLQRVFRPEEWPKWIRRFKRRNKIFERAKCNQREQKGGESVDRFITALYTLSEHCEYGNLREEMIRGRIIVGILNSRLLDPDLKLETAVTKVCQNEAVKQQQSIVRGKDSEMTIEDASA